MDYVRLKEGPPSRYISSQELLMPFILLLENTQTFEQHNLLAVVLGLFVNVSSQVGLLFRYNNRCYLILIVKWQ